jgi:glucokinase
MSEILETFFSRGDGSERQRVEAASFAVAGPIVDDHCEIPNLAWEIDGKALQTEFGFRALSLLNDLEGTAEGISALGDDELYTLNEGTPPLSAPKTRAVIAAGTGLGMAILHRTHNVWHVLPTEGGHADLAPRNELEMDLLRFLLRRHKRVSIERVLSGPGLVALYDFFYERDPSEANAEVRAAIEADRDDAPALVSRAATEHRCPVSERALRLFIEQYGAAAGNLGLATMSQGGVYLGGGIAPKILDELKDGTFVTAFTTKGRLSPVLERMPVKVILNQKTALLGAASRAAQLL